jgi:transposase-like protein
MQGSGANAWVAGDDEKMQQFVPIEDLFKGRHFDRQIIVLCVRWYTSFKLSLRDLVIMMADRGISVTHTTILRWVQHYLPEFEKRWRRYARPVGGSWRMDETYIKVHGQWVYLYRAVDKAGQTVDFYLSRNRDVNAAKSFLRSAMKNTRVPMKITLDAYAASHRAVREMKEDGVPHLRSNHCHLPLQRPPLRSGKQQNDPHRDGDSAVHGPSNLAAHEAARKDVDALEEPHAANKDEEYANDLRDDSHGTRAGVPDSMREPFSMTRTGTQPTGPRLRESVLLIRRGWKPTGSSSLSSRGGVARTGGTVLATTNVNCRGRKVVFESLLLPEEVWTWIFHKSSLFDARFMQSSTSARASLK